MASLKEIYLNFLDNNNISLDGKNVCIALSTGVDSSVLLDLTMKYTDANIIICHVNHGKREESNVEEEYVKSFCLEKGLKYYIHHIKPEDIKGNFQEEARKIRYSFFKEVMRKEHAEFLLLAHHLNDDIETMLLRMERGSSLKGFSGIDSIVKIDEGFILRPLLSVLKNDIYEYADECEIKYFEDSSNATDHYSRNVIRHRDIPEIFKTIENASSDFVEMKKNIVGAVCIINEYRDKLIENTFEKIDNGYKFRISEFLFLNEFIQVEIIFEICKKYSLSKKAVLEIISLFKSDKANIETTLSDLTVIKSYDNGYILYSYPDNNIEYTLTDLKEGIFDIGNCRKIEVTKIYNFSNEKILKDCSVMCFNSNKLPITIRSVNQYDEMIFDYGHKSISRIFIDKKIDLMKRHDALVVSKNDTIFMLVGIEKSKIAFGDCACLSNCDFTIKFL